MHRTPLNTLFFVWAVIAGLVFADGKGNPLDKNPDLQVYFNTRQAQQAMDKALWDRIQNDKNASLSKSKDPFGQSLKDKDIEALLNLHLLSEKPLCVRGDGAAIVSGGVAKEIGLLKEMVSESENQISLKETKLDGKTIYHLDVKLFEEGHSIDAWLQAEGEKVALGFLYDESQNERKAYDPGNPDFSFAKNAVFKEQSFILSGKSDKVITLLNMLENSDKELSRILGAFYSFKVNGRVQGTKLFIKVLADAKDAKVAEEHAASMKALSEHISGNTWVGDANVSLSGKVLELRFSLDIGRTWSFMMHIRQNEESQNLQGSEDDDEDDDED